MPLRGLFSKKNKSRVDVTGAERDGVVTGEIESTLSSPTTEYIKPERSLPSSPNGKSTASLYPSIAASPPASSSKLRLPFGRKKASAKSNASNVGDDDLRPPQFSSRHSTSNASESDISEVRSDRTKLGPPPSKSAIFAAYGDPNGALSTRSLPNGYRADEPLPSPPTANTKRPSLFPWSAKSQPNTTKFKNKDKPKSTPPSANDISAALDDSSFNLKSFRHVRAPPPPHEPSSSQQSLVPPPPIGTRSRNSSVGSLSDLNQSQQRISVAAFREAQARRSQAGSPVPNVGGARSPSPGPNAIPALPNAPSSSTPSGRPRRSSIAFGSGNAYQDSSEEDESEEEVDSDDEPMPSRKTGLRPKVKAKAKSELGHGMMSVSPSSTHTAPTLAPPSTKPSPSAQLRPQKPGGNAPRAQSSLGLYNGGRVNENAGAVNASRKMITSTASQRPSSSSSSSSSESDTDSDNAPLAMLVAPRRPGSAMSSSSRNSNPSTAKPPSVPAMPAKLRSGLGPGGRKGTDSDTHSHSSTNSHPPHSTSTTSSPNPRARSRTNSAALSISSTPTNPQKPKPLIDINTLTGPNRRPLESGGAALGAGRVKNMEGFTGGATLLSAGTTVSASGSGLGSARDSRASSPPLSSVTSTSPPRRFVSPPSSPVMGERALTPSQQQQQHRRKMSGFGGVRREMQVKEGDAVSLLSRSSATESSVSGSGSGSGATYNQDVQTQTQSQAQGRKRDMFSERLNRVVQQSVGGAGASASAPTLSLNLSDELVIPRTESPSPIRSPAAGAGWKGFSDDRGHEESLPTPPSKSGLDTAEAQSQMRSQPQIASQQMKPSTMPSLTLPSLQTFTFGRSEETAVGRHQKKKSEDSPDSQIEDLASVLGAGIKLVSLNGEDEAEYGVSNGAGQGGDEGMVRLAYDEEPDRPPSPNRIAPIPIKRRMPAPSFSVTSRPQHARGAASISVLASSSSPAVGEMTSTSTTTTTTTTTTSVVTQSQNSTNRSPPVAGVTRPRSSTLMPTINSVGGIGATSTWSMVSGSGKLGAQSGVGVSSESTASSSTSASESSSASASASEKEKSTRGGRFKLTSEPLRDREREREEQERAQSSSGSGVGLGLGLGKGVLGISKGPPPPPRQRTTSAASRMPSIPASPNTTMFPGPAPSKPFAGSRSGSGSGPGSPRGLGMGESPASSTGGSSSGRAPVTPRDGSDLGGSAGGYRRSELGKEKGKEQWSSGVSGLSLGGKHMRKRSVALDEDDSAGPSPGSGKNRELVDEDNEESRRKERRRSEAKAAIELGNTINGRGPILDDDEDEDLPISQTAAGARMNPTMMGGQMPMSMSMQNGFGPLPTGSAGWGGPWPGQMPQMPTGSSMLSPAQFLVPPPSDPAMFAAHQQAMMIAKQAYQMAVAQQAMAMAAEEWERGSAIGFSSSQSMYGGPAPSVMGSVYGGGMGMGMGMGMGGGNGWSAPGSEIFPTGPRSAYGGARSEYGGGGGGWGSSRSVYGESFGPSSSTNRVSRPSLPSSGQGQRMSSYSRDSGHYPPVPPVPQSHKNAGPSSRQAVNPRARTVSQPANPSRPSPGAGQRRPPPPSSWKANGV